MRNGIDRRRFLAGSALALAKPAAAEIASKPLEEVRIGQSAWGIEAARFCGNSSE